MVVALRDTDHGYRALFSRLAGAKRRMGAATSGSPSHRITVGIHDAEGEEAKLAYDGHATAITVAEVAATHEFGAGVPERSFIRSWFDENRARLVQELKHVQAAELAGDVDVMRQVAQRWQSEVRARVTSRGAGFAPLAPATIAARTRAGITHETPLDATGQLVGAICAVVDGEYA